MATVTQSLGKNADRLSQAGRDILEGTKAAFKKAPAVEATEAVAETAKRGLGSRLVGGTARGIWHVASRPLVWATDFAGFTASKVGAGFKAHPRLALGATAVAAGLGIGHVMNKRAERDAQDQINQLEQAQLRVAQAQAQANTVTPADYAAMEARMRQGGQNGGFAAGVQAERAQGVQGPAV